MRKNIVILRLTALLFGGFALLLTGLFGLLRQSPSSAAYLLFTSDRDGNWDLYRLRPDGQDLRQLTFDGANGSVAWSPDAVWIAFWSRRDRNEDIYLMRADGTQLQRLTHHPAKDKFPAWSADGRWITFESYRDGPLQRYRMRPDGTHLTLIATLPDTHLITADQLGGWFSWSPDGKHQAFMTSDDGDYNIYRVDADGSNLRQLTDHPATDLTPLYSPAIDLTWNGRLLTAFSLALMGGFLIVPRRFLLKLLHSERV